MRGNMIELGKMQTLTVLRIKDFGVYLGHEGEKESVLLPRKQVPQGTKEGDEIEVFVYKDSMDRIISTTRRPLLVMDEMAVLTVKENTKKYGNRLSGRGSFIYVRRNAERGNRRRI